MVFNRKFISLICISFFISSCSVMRSGPVNPNAPSTYHSGGSYSLPMSLMTFTVNVNKEGYLSVEEPVLHKVPDHKMVFTLDYLTDISSDDTFKIELDGKGFLKQISAVADDKKGPIIEVIAATVATLMTGIPIPLADGSARSHAIDQKGIVLKHTINPNNPNELAELNGKLNKYNLKVEVNPFETKQVKNLPEPNDSTERTGIFYRPLLPYQVSVLALNNNEWEKFSSYVIYTENLSPLISIDISRSYFAKRETTLVFDSGVLTSAEVKKPSEFLGLVRVPYNIASALVELPAKILKLRVDQTTNQASLVEKQQALLEAQQKFNELNNSKLKNSTNNKLSGD